MGLAEGGVRRQSMSTWKFLRGQSLSAIRSLSVRVRPACVLMARRLLLLQTMQQSARMTHRPAQFVYDVFVSYRWVEPDMSWVRGHFVPALKVAGLRVCLDVQDFIPGRDLILEMTRAGRESCRAVCVLSPDYFDGDRFGYFESLMFRRSDPSGREGRLIPLLLRTCCIPEWLHGLIPVDWTCPDLDAQWERLLAALGAPRLNSRRPGNVEDTSFLALGSGVLPPFDAAEATRTIAEAKDPVRASAVVRGLVDEIARREDPTERYWIYTALGKIGGRSALAALTQALSDSNPFAREGAHAALTELKRRQSKRSFGQTIQWLVLSVGCIVLLALGLYSWQLTTRAISNSARLGDRAPPYAPRVAYFTWNETGDMKMIFDRDGEKWELQVSFPLENETCQIIINKL